MYFLRPVYGDADKETAFPEEIRPLPIEQDTVGLDSVVHRFACSIFLLEFNSFPIEIDSHYKRFAAVPIEHDLIIFVGLDIGLDGLLEHFQTHAGFSPSIDLRLVEIIAVSAVEVAQRTGRLEHHVERQRARKTQRIVQFNNIFRPLIHQGSFILYKLTENKTCRQENSRWYHPIDVLKTCALSSPGNR